MNRRNFFGSSLLAAVGAFLFGKKSNNALLMKCSRTVPKSTSVKWKGVEYENGIGLEEQGVKPGYTGTLAFISNYALVGGGNVKVLAINEVKFVDGKMVKTRKLEQHEWDLI